MDVCDVAIKDINMDRLNDENSENDDDDDVASITTEENLKMYKSGQILFQFLKTLFQFLKENIFAINWKMKEKSN